jgi:hypothetical protein
MIIAEIMEWTTGASSPMEAATMDHKIRVRLLRGALCRSKYHELIEDPDEVTQPEDGDDDPEHD